MEFNWGGCLAILQTWQWCGLHVAYLYLRQPKQMIAGLLLSMTGTQMQMDTAECDKHKWAPPVFAVMFRRANFSRMFC